MPTEKQMNEFCYSMLKQVDLKGIDWTKVAQENNISNGHAARMRWSRFRSQMGGGPGQGRNSNRANGGNGNNTTSNSNNNKDAGGKDGGNGKGGSKTSNKRNKRDKNVSSPSSEDDEPLKKTAKKGIKKEDTATAFNSPNGDIWTHSVGHTIPFSYDRPSNGDGRGDVTSPQYMGPYDGPADVHTNQGLSGTTPSPFGYGAAIGSQFGNATIDNPIKVESDDEAKSPEPTSSDGRAESLIKTETAAEEFPETSPTSEQANVLAISGAPSPNIKAEPETAIPSDHGMAPIAIGAATPNTSAAHSSAVDPATSFVTTPDTTIMQQPSSGIDNTAALAVNNPQCATPSPPQMQSQAPAMYVASPRYMPATTPRSTSAHPGMHPHPFGLDGTAPAQSMSPNGYNFGGHAVQNVGSGSYDYGAMSARAPQWSWSGQNGYHFGSR